MTKKSIVAEKRNYRVKLVDDAKKIASEYLKNIELSKVVRFGLPEIDDRYHCWRVPLVSQNKTNIGEIVIDAFSSLVSEKKTTQKKVLESRLLGRKTGKRKKRTNDIPKISNLRNTIGLGDSEALLTETPLESVDLIFTSPPYYNARPEYSDFITYEEYLLKMRKIIHQCHRVLNEGRFFVLNISPVLVRRASRSESSKRIAVPFDFHRLFIEEGYEFIDDIIWVKPEGAGWATGRGRRFSADRNPLQYKPVPVTEYLLVYRKKTDKLIDWHIRKHPDKEIVRQSKVQDGYEVTNIWKIHPAHNKAHPAVFPVELAEKVITYYSFINDVILDPFAGTGTVGKAASNLKRRFVLFEINSEYIQYIKNNIDKWQNTDVSSINWINSESVSYQLNFNLE
ncbi:DNA-methyltransferase [Desulfonema magnum]|uniref:Methyltransferase n=1 Tax=Desulfonema magnum TaxID=45655 RepID=A0A975BND3_9BACT|nr:site-specific DNA-methyltransferase [Desulfonema magnum]QTA88194.1 SAM-dependent methyltransferase [Desulfonema magnum]